MSNDLQPREWLKEIRGKRTQKEMSEALGISRQYYSQLELGLRGTSYTTACKLAEKLGIPWSKFYEDENPAVK